MGRKPCCDKVGLKRGPWKIEEDHKRVNFILTNGIRCWRVVPKLAGGQRLLHIFPVGRTMKSRTIEIKRRPKLLGLDAATHKPMDQAEACTSSDMKDYSVQDIISKLTEEEESLKAKSPDDEVRKEHAKAEENQEQEDQLLALEETSHEDILKDYEMLYGSLELGPAWSNQESSNPSTSYSSSLISGRIHIQSLSMQEDSLQQWVDGADSILSWDGLDHLDADLFIM